MSDDRNPWGITFMTMFDMSVIASVKSAMAALTRQRTTGERQAEIAALRNVQPAEPAAQLDLFAAVGANLEGSE